MRPAFEHPYAITMWDFSWLERRWPGAGYEDWDRALEELTDRGYDAVRIDAYPHLIAEDGQREWELLPQWNQMSWGAQSIIRVRVLPALLDFIRAAARAGVSVALSTWFREDRDNVRVGIRSPRDMARIWIETLRAIDAAGLIEHILYVDLCNEFPMAVWAPFMYTEQWMRNIARSNLPKDATLESLRPAPIPRTSPALATWMAEAIAIVREEFPDIDYTFSSSAEVSTWREQDVAAFDVLEPHIWMAGNDHSDYYENVGYDFEAFDPAGFDNVVARGRVEYERDRERYDATLFRTIDEAAEWARASRKGLYTTECWALIDYKDWPGLEWDWMLDLNARAVEYVVTTGRWVGISTSNFCGPQFAGMWREIDWHRRLTGLIRSAPVDIDLHRGVVR